MAELADALASGASGGNPVEVRVLSSAIMVHKAEGGIKLLYSDILW